MNLSFDFISRIRGDRQTVGIDIGHYSIKLVRVYHHHTGKIQVTAVDIEVLPENTIEDGEIKNMDNLREALNKILARQIDDRDALDFVVGINSASGVLIDKLTVKVAKSSNESDIIIKTAESRPPFDDKDNILEFQVYDRKDGEVKVNLVAAKSVILDAWAELYKDVDVQLTAIDVDVFALANVYMAFVEPETKKDTVALFNIGEKYSSLVFLMDGCFHSTRALTAVSVESVIAVLMRHLGLDSAQCHELFEKGESFQVEGFSEADIESVFHLAYEEILGAFEFGLRYFSNSESDEKPSKVLLSGGGASLPGLVDYIKERTGYETEYLNPFDKVPVDINVVNEGDLSKALSNIYAPALGYAMRKF